MPEVATGVVLPDAVRAEALETARTILDRLADDAVVSAAVAATEKTTGHPVWHPTSLYSGPAGTALALTSAAQALPEEADQWMAGARRSLRLMADGTRSAPVSSASMAAGTSGIALAVTEAAAVDPRYGRTLADLHQTLAKQVDELATAPGDALGFWHYDVNMGPAGILGHLTALPAGLADPSARQAERALVDMLVRLSGRGWEGWRIPRQNYPLRPIEHKLYPYGYVDLGLAHGLPGPLSALSRARLNGDRRPSVRSAIEVLAAQVIEASRFDARGRVWPRLMPFDASGDIAPEMTEVAGPAYCYGSPGICSALLDAADALDDASIEAIAVEGFEAMALQLLDDSGPHSPGLCHGFAGLLLISQKFSERPSCPVAQTTTATLTEELLRSCDPEQPLMVRDYKPAEAGAPGSPLANTSTGAWINQPDLMDGAAGVASTLLSVATDTPANWSRALLVGGARRAS